MQTELLSSLETGKLGLMHLKRLWHKVIQRRNGGVAPNNEPQLDKTALYVSGIGLEQGISKIFNTSSFDEFEDWIIATAGWPSVETRTRFNSMVSGQPTGITSCAAKIFTADEVSFFNENGYIILKNAISASDCQDTIDAICNFTGINEHDPATWYDAHHGRQAIMVQLFQSPAMQKTRENTRIRQAYEQLWNRTDIWPSTDRGGFNPPETERYAYQGQDLHWDVSLQLPIPFGLQGLIYLTDTEADQGAFTLVPGFQHRAAAWLNSLPAGAEPRRQNLHELGSKPIAANAGDMIIWQQALPHGASANRSAKPRFVQYLTYNPADLPHQPEWI